MKKIIRPSIRTNSKKAHKYKEIYHDLHKIILSGKVLAGDKLPTEAELVEKYRTSRITVARALRDLQAESLIDRRAGSGSYVRRPDNSEPTFGLLIPDLGRTEIFDPICQGMSRAGQKRSYSLSWGKTLPEVTNQEVGSEELCHQYIRNRVSGVFFAPLELTPAKDAVNRNIVQKLDAAGIPIVLLDRDVEAYPRRSRYDVIGIDNRRAGYTVTEHLLKLGSRRIGFVGRPSSASTVAARIAGYIEALLAYGVEVDRSLIRQAEPDDEDALKRIMETASPEALVCANDYTAAKVIQGLLRLGYSIPRDLRIVGIDDVKYAGLLQVPLTTIHQPCHHIGAAAIEAMFDQLAVPDMPARDILLDFRLVVRESCGSAARNGQNRRAPTEVL